MVSCSASGSQAGRNEAIASSISAPTTAANLEAIAIGLESGRVSRGIRDRHWLFTTLGLAGEITEDRLLLEAATVGASLPTDQPHQLGAIAPCWIEHAPAKHDLVAGRCMEAIEIPDYA